MFLQSINLKKKKFWDTACHCYLKAFKRQILSLFLETSNDQETVLGIQKGDNLWVMWKNLVTMKTMYPFLKMYVLLANLSFRCCKGGSEDKQICGCTIGYISNLRFKDTELNATLSQIYSRFKEDMLSRVCFSY